METTGKWSCAVVTALENCNSNLLDLVLCVNIFPPKKLCVLQIIVINYFIQLCRMEAKVLETEISKYVQIKTKMSF